MLQSRTKAGLSGFGAVSPSHSPRFYEAGRKPCDLSQGGFTLIYMFITNIYLRLVVGIYVIVVGIIFLKIYFDRDKDNIWGDIYRSEILKYRNKAKIYLILGLFSIIVGLIALLFGFCLNITGGC